MNLSDLLTSMQSHLSTELPNWDVTIETVPYAADKLLEIRYGPVTIGYVDFDTTSYVGNLELAFYSFFPTSYASTVSDIETATKSLSQLNLADVTIGAQGSQLGTIQKPTIIQDTQKSYYEIVVTVPFELLNI